MRINNIQDLVLKNGLKLLFAFTILISFAYVLSPFIIPVLLGGILAMAFSPFVGFFMKRGFTRRSSMRLLTFTIFLIGVIPTTLFFVRGSRIITEMIKDKNNIMNSEFLITRVETLIKKVSNIYGLPAETLTEQFHKGVEASSNFLVGTFSGLFSQILDLGLIAIITICSIYFFLRNEEKIRILFNHYFFFTPPNGDRFVKMMRSSCREVFFSNVLTGIIQSLVVSIGSMIAGVGDFFLIFFITFIVSFIPVVGAGPVALILSCYAFIVGNVAGGIILLVITVVAGVSDNIVRPYLASLGSVEVPPFIGFMAVIGGVILLGLPGLFLAPLIASIAFGMMPIFFDEYIKKPQKE